MKKKIYIKDWLELKPYESHKPTDTYYLKIANDLKSIFMDIDFMAFRLYLEDAEIKMLFFFLVFQFEDVVSGTNIFDTFRKEHKMLNEKPLPFYTTRTYYEDEINQADVTFLSWYFLNTVQQRDFALPHHKVFPAFAEKVMEIFDREYEYAPENEALKPYYRVDENETDYYKIRSIVETILLGTSRCLAKSFRRYCGSCSNPSRFHRPYNRALKPRFRGHIRIPYRRFPSPFRQKPEKPCGGAVRNHAVARY